MKKYISIQADKARNLRYNFNALIKLEEAGIDITTLEQNISFKNINTLVWAGLIHEDKELTIEQAGDVIDEAMEHEGLKGLMEKVGEAISLSFGTAPAHPATKGKK